MSDLAVTLTPLIIGSAIVPIQIIITILLLRPPAKRSVAVAWLAGMTAVRLLQGLVFGMILHWGRRDDTKGGHGWVVSSVLLVVALLLLVTAIRELLGGDDPDDPPPKWMAALSSMTPGKAFLLGAAVILISVKLWVFTFAAIGAIGDAGMPRSTNAVTYIVFVLLGLSTHLAIIAAAAFFPTKSRALLDNSLRWLQDHNRVIMIALGLVFGAWFLYKGLHGFGII
jgi:hypothetical protein